MWVKGSGSDLARVTASSFTGLRLDDVLALLERERLSHSEMTRYLRRCEFEVDRPRCSIEIVGARTRDISAFGGERCAVLGTRRDPRAHRAASARARLAR